MRCSCKVCGTYMVHAEDMTLGCICPECKNRCTACLGTNSVMSREEIKKLGEIPGVVERMFFRDNDEKEDRF